MPSDRAPTRDDVADDEGFLPYWSWWPIFGGAFVGVAMRAAYAFGLSPMSASFVLLTPVLVSAVTVWLAERESRRTWSYYAASGMLANVLFVGGTLATLLEGMICAIVVVPLMAVVGAVAGVVMGAVCRTAMSPRPVVYTLAVLPLALSVLEQNLPLPQTIDEIDRRVVVQAPPERVWAQIHHAADIRTSEVDRGWAYRIGVPEPVAGITETTPEGRVRHVTMGKGIHFDQVVTDWQENRRVRFFYRFAPDSVPAGALDEHVRIGGRHFDLVDTSYDLEPAGSGATALTIRIHYRVSTGFNAYARPVARLLIGNVGDVLLDFYRARSERP